MKSMRSEASIRERLRMALKEEHDKFPTGGPDESGDYTTSRDGWVYGAGFIAALQWALGEDDD